MRMTTMAWSGFLAALLALGGCGGTATPGRGRATDPNAPPADRTKELAAERELADLEAQVAEQRKLPAAERTAAEQRFGGALERTVAHVAGTHVENKALYWLASWRFTYRDGDGVDDLLDRLNQLKSPAFRNAGKALRVQLRLRQGQVREARTIAEPLVAQIPEFKGLLDLVAWHETVGQAAPHVASRNLSGGPDDPLGRGEPWLLWLFVERVDDNALQRIARYQQALAALPNPAMMRLVVVAFDPSPLNATATLLNQGQGKGPVPDLMWANPNANGTSKAWETAWKLPQPLPHSALLGPDRTIMAVELPPEEVMKVVGGGAKK